MWLLSQPMILLLNAQSKNMVGPYYFNEEPPQNVLKIIESITGKIIITPQNVPAARITFEMPTSLPKEDALIALESLLQMNGVALTPLGDKFLKAVPTAGVNTQVPELLTVKPSSLTPSQRIYSTYIQLKYLNTQQVENLIRPSLTPGTSTMISDEKNNLLFITDTLNNLQRVEEMLDKIDKPTTSAEEIRFFTINHVKVSDLSAELERMLQSTLKKQLAGNTSFSFSDRTNQLIVTSHPDNLKVLENIINQLDIDVDPLTKSQVIYLKHAKAEEVQALIEKIISGQNENKDSVKQTTSGTTEVVQVTEGSPANANQTAPVTEITSINACKCIRICL